MKLWLLINHRSTKFKIDSFVHAAAQNNLELMTIRTEELLIVTSSQGQELFWQGQPVTLPAGVISLTQLFTMPLSTHEREILAFFESQSVKVINTLVARENATNKAVSYRLLSQAGVPIPKTTILFPELKLEQVIARVGLPLIVKPLDSFKGHGVVLIENNAQLHQFLDFTSYFMEPRQTLIAQEFIESSKGKDVRVMVLGDQVLGGMVRQGAPDSVVSNFAAGAKVTPYALDSQTAALALKAAQAVGLEFAGVDLLFTTGGFVVCEVNANPGFEGFVAATGIDVASAVLKYLQTKIGT